MTLSLYFVVLHFNTLLHVLVKERLFEFRE